MAESILRGREIDVGYRPQWINGLAQVSAMLIRRIVPVARE
ncbi:MAG: hypothetical protein AAGE59_16145 [Cyanobacteria bacterium P01_F01_bin.86]